jgi:hypothetical protein
VRWLHLTVGIVGVVGFLGTGQYMDRAHDHLRGMDDARRLLFRSTQNFSTHKTVRRRRRRGAHLQSRSGAPGAE